MSNNRELKEVKVQEIHEKMTKAKSAVVMDYRGLTVSEVTELRNRFRDSNVDYHVYKNRLVKLAIKDTAYESLTDSLVGPNAIAISYDEPTTPAKIAKEYAKKNNKLELRCGVIEGEFYDEQGIQVIADIPSKEVLVARFLGSITTPVSKLARTLVALAESKQE